MPRAGRGLGGTDENAASFEFPEETSIGEQPRFPSESPGEEHTLVGSADESSEAIEVVDELLDEDHQPSSSSLSPLAGHQDGVPAHVRGGPQDERLVGRAVTEGGSGKHGYA